MLSKGVPISIQTHIPTFRSMLDPATSTYKRNWVILNADTLSAPPRILEVDPRITVSWRLPVFSPDGLALVYVISSENNVDNLWLQPLDGKPGRQITQFAAPLKALPRSQGVFGVVENLEIQPPQGFDCLF